MAKTNKQVLEAIVDAMPMEAADKIRGLSGAEVLSVFEEYPTVRNEFINSLTNKVCKTLIFNRPFTNPLEMLKKGKLEYGDSIEAIMVELAEMKNFHEHWDEDGTPESDLIRELRPSVLTQYYTRNIDKKLKSTVSDKKLRKAFLNENGLYNLVNQIVMSIQNKKNLVEYQITRDTLLRAVDGINYNGVDLVTGDGVTRQKMHSIDLGEYDKNPTLLVEKVRAITGNLKFISDEYNMAKVNTFTPSSELVLFTTSDIQAKLDTVTLAHAFNVSNVELQTRTILLDKLDIRGTAGTYTKEDDGIGSTVTCTNSALPEGKTPVAILIDKDFLQLWSVYEGAGSFYNPEGEYTNFFANFEMLAAVSMFSNSILFYK